MVLVSKITTVLSRIFNFASIMQIPSAENTDEQHNLTICVRDDHTTEANNFDPGPYFTHKRKFKLFDAIYRVLKSNDDANTFKLLVLHGDLMREVVNLPGINGTKGRELICKLWEENREEAINILSTVLLNDGQWPTAEKTKEDIRNVCSDFLYNVTGDVIEKVYGNYTKGIGILESDLPHHSSRKFWLLRIDENGVEMSRFQRGYRLLADGSKLNNDTRYVFYGNPPPWPTGKPEYSMKWELIDCSDSS
ncbi:hypothetical protein U1Q18_049895 [Sarracenia purpurea var. burkii]